jgi:pimeloyl-ACP methyl ester carboxylesterase
MPNSLPILIVGGFGVSWQFYRPFKQVLTTVSGRPTFIAPLALIDWLGVVGSGEYSALLRRLDRSVDEVLAVTGRSQVLMIGHSAGGILARIFLGDQPYGRNRLVFNGFQRVATLVTLGTPHNAAHGGRIGGRDQIMFAQQTYPGAYWRFLRYVTVMGRAIRGAGKGTLRQRNAYQSYAMIAGRGDLWGDGVVPLDYGLLEGAEQVILEGIYHDARPEQRWYGQDEDAILSWWQVVETVEREPARSMRRA